MNADPQSERIMALERPHPSLWTYYIICAVLTGPGIPITLPYLYFRYHTLRYRFDEEGIHMRVGILFRREINLTYARIQDIHLRSGIIQRWLGLANVEVQTASGSSGAELVVEGFKEFEAIRDFLYTRMRGFHDRSNLGSARTSGVTASNDVMNASAVASGTTPPASPEMVSLLLGIRDELRRTRELLESNSSASGTPPRIPPHV